MSVSPKSVLDEVLWLSWGKALVQLCELQDELASFFMEQDRWLKNYWQTNYDYPDLDIWQTIFWKWT